MSLTDALANALPVELAPDAATENPPPGPAAIVPGTSPPGEKVTLPL